MLLKNLESRILPTFIHPVDIFPAVGLKGRTLLRVDMPPKAQTADGARAASEAASEGGGPPTDASAAADADTSNNTTSSCSSKPTKKTKKGFPKRCGICQRCRAAKVQRPRSFAFAWNVCGFLLLQIKEESRRRALAQHAPPREARAVDATRLANRLKPRRRRRPIARDEREAEHGDEGDGMREPPAPDW